MDITSLIITFVGFIIILAIYIISRLSRSKLPQTKEAKIPNLTNEDGSQFTSVLDDIPARDGSSTNVAKTTSTTSNKSKSSNDETLPKKEQQHILFISPNDEKGLEGNLVSKVLKKNGLVLGDLDIYHYYSESNDSLFRVANGVDPWTLTKEDLNNKFLAGLSIVLITPSGINDTDAVKTFISVSHKLSQEMNGVLKNNQQQLFTPKDETTLLNSL